jgi:hypothetical protein
VWRADETFGSSVDWHNFNGFDFGLEVDRNGDDKARWESVDVSRLVPIPLRSFHRGSN